MKRSLYFPVFVLLTLPWLNPFASGPSPSVVPWLFSMACAAGAVLLGLQASTQTSAVAPLRLDLKEAVAASLLIAGLASSVLALAQYFDVAARFAPWVNQTGPGQAFANLRQRNQFATLTNLALVALLWLHVREKVQQKVHLSSAAAKTTFHFWPLTVVGLLAVGNAISSSRTGLVQLLLVCGMYVTWNGLGNLGIRRLLSCAVLVYVLAALAMPHIAGLDLSTHGTFARFGQDDGCASRLTLWANVLTLIAQKPWLGWGWGELDYAHYITLYPGARFCDILSNAHNLPLHLAVELGVPVALMVCGVAVWLVLRARPWRETDATRQLAWGVLALILLHSMLEYPLWYGPFQMAFGLCVYLLWATRTRSARAVQLAAYPGPAAASRSYLQLSVRPDDVSIPVRPELVERFLFHRAGSMALVAMLMLATALAAWDYHRVSQLYLTPAQRAAAYREDTLEKTRGTWFFKQQFDFALLGLTPLTPENALQIHTLSHRLLHFSPEPRVIEKVIESAVMLGRDDEAMLHLARYRAAFAQEQVRWRSSVVLTEQPAK